MEPSLFEELVLKYFRSTVLSITTTLNGVDDAGNARYYFQRFLGTRQSIDGKWEALSVAGTRIMADVIAMDSSIPLKKRPSLSSASGEIPKLAMEMALNESDLTKLQLMQAATGIYTERDIILDLFRDTRTVVEGQYERIEHMFLEGLSRGAIVVAKGPNLETNVGNVGTEIRLDFNYPANHMFESSVAWSNPDATPISDLAVVVNQSEVDGYPIRRFLLDRVTMNNIARTDEAKAIYAEVNNIIQGVTFAPTEAQLNSAVQARYGYVFEVINRTTQYQINGVDTAVQPWAAGQVVGINNDNLGDLVWSRLAEMAAPVAGVEYQTANQFILAAKYRVNRPSLAEFTSSQSRAIPVISAVQQIYHINTTVDGGPLVQAAGGSPEGRMTTASVDESGDKVAKTNTTAKTK